MLFTRLDKRLSAVAAFVRPGSFAADIGTDHALLPIALIENGHCKEVIATDVVDGPLRSAQRNIISSGLEDKIVLRKCDGLSGVSSHVEDIIIAGMGGELILSIITAASWLQNPDKRLILQPMTQEHKLREGLCALGFTIDEEAAVKDGIHVYCILCVHFSGEKKQVDKLYAYIGEMPHGRGDVREYLTRQASTLARVAVMLGQSRAQADTVRARDHASLAQSILQRIPNAK